MKRISVYEPIFQGNEKKYLQQCIDSGWVSSDGYFVRKFEEEFAKWSNNKYAITVCNGTVALQTAIYSLDIKTCISVPVQTIISCAIAVINNKLEPHFYYGNKFSENLIRCHLFGELCKAYGKKTIDDCSQYWKPLNVQDVGCYSLYANKLITCGEGGILVTNNKEIYERAKNYRNLCHSKERFIHYDLGNNFRMSNIQAAVALAQLEQINNFIEIKQKIKSWYKKYLPDEVKILFNVEIPWMFLIQTNRDAGIMVNKLFQKGIECRRNFYPLHRQPCFNGKYEHLYFPEVDRIWETTFYLPSGLNLEEKNVRYICKELRQLL